MKRVVGILLVMMAVLPAAGLISVAALMATAARSCAVGSLSVARIPDSLEAQTRDGTRVVLGRHQLTHAATIITVAEQTSGVGRPGALIAIMAALTESGLRMLANPSAYPQSAGYPNDGSGSDHDSLGMFQMRPSTEWGTVTELMDPAYQVRAFFGGPSGPNEGRPRGLLDIPGWQALDPGEAAQMVEVSAYPDRYENYRPVAEAILVALTARSPASAHGGAAIVPETSRLVFPLPMGRYTDTSSYGWRTDPFTGARAFHEGSDLAAAMGTPILAIADGVVAFAGLRGGYGGLIILEHTVNGQRVASFYAHMYESRVHVDAGDTVTAGELIGDVGSAGRSTGPHLHLEIHPGGAGQPTVNAIDWLSQRGAEGIDETDAATAVCEPLEAS
ncbi:M23 family metallopeptidase [Microbacterium sp. 2FI]|uniref:M23 family metallopeptidase n=1 Tax=Microbacterium sp. 2FI TaxID=2502193 RepID=UPI0010FA4D4F|nr:M23 family metallopeptidase [Microbacterium sp. 2FI]